LLGSLITASQVAGAARWTWWLPGWLDRALPHLHVEGDPARLTSVGTPRQPQPGDDRPAAGRIALLTGVLVGWVVGVAAAGQTSPSVGAAVALAAAAGGVLAVLPRSTRGADGPLWLRLAVLLLSALVSLAAAMLVSGLTPATDRNPVLQSGAALLVPLTLAALTPLRRLALPIALGATAMVISMLSGEGPNLPAVVLPVLAAALVTRLVGALGRALRQGGDRDRNRDRAGGPDPASDQDRAGEPGRDREPDRTSDRAPGEPQPTPPGPAPVGSAHS
jgi:hypothetical protein